MICTWPLTSGWSCDKEGINTILVQMTVQATSLHLKASNSEKVSINSLHVPYCFYKVLFLAARCLVTNYGFPVVFDHCVNGDSSWGRIWLECERVGEGFGMSKTDISAMLVITLKPETQPNSLPACSLCPALSVGFVYGQGSNQHLRHKKQAL